MLNYIFKRNKKIKCYILFVIFFIFLFLTFGIAKVNGDSMMPSLSDKEWTLYIKKNNISRYDIVLVEVDSKIYIKRVIGLPGEKIEYKNNILFVNEIQTEENYNRTKTADFLLESIENIDKIPNNYFLVLGDNRSYSYDSRNFGLIELHQIKGKVLFH